ncbi:MAG: uroporphyrinogen decarboxylase family protein [Chloroflexota bacterium]
MNNRQRFNAILHYQAVDRCPLVDFGFWDETIPAWHAQGLPLQIDMDSIRSYLGMDFTLTGLDEGTGIFDKLHPLFEERQIEDLGENEVVQQPDGVQVLRRKSMSSIPQPLRYRLVDRDSWRRDYKPRLDPTAPGRYPADWERRAQTWRDPLRTEIIGLRGGGLYGYLRNWMGLERVSMVLYDDPAWFEEMVETLADLFVGMLEHVFASGGTFDACHLWEDMCYSAGPLISPRHFRKFLMPHYRRITDVLHRHNVDIISVDSDGKIDALAPLWLEVGINTMFPFEVGTWRADPYDFRRRFGRQLRILGGFDKNILRASPAEISAEVRRLAPLVEEGGYIPHCDHLVPPDVPYRNYLHYLRQARQVWARNLDLPAMPADEPLTNA